MGLIMTSLRNEHHLILTKKYNADPNTSGTAIGYAVFRHSDNDKCSSATIMNAPGLSFGRGSAMDEIAWLEKVINR